MTPVPIEEMDFEPGDEPLCECCGDKIQKEVYLDGMGECFCEDCAMDLTGERDPFRILDEMRHSLELEEEAREYALAHCRITAPIPCSWAAHDSSEYRELVAHHRHNSTNYEWLLESCGRDPENGFLYDAIKARINELVKNALCGFNDYETEAEET